EGATAQRREQSERPLRTPRARPSSRGIQQIRKRIGHGHGLAHSTPPARATASAPIPRSGASKASGLYARRERGHHPRGIQQIRKLGVSESGTGTGWPTRPEQRRREQALTYPAAARAKRAAVTHAASEAIIQGASSRSESSE